MTTADTDFSKTYADWLASRVTQQVREGVVEITTPMLDSFNDGMRVFLEHREGATVIHDGGITLETLALRGVDPTKPSARRNTLNRMLAASRAVLAGDRIEVTATTANIPQRIHFLLTAMSRVGDMWAVAKARGSEVAAVEDAFERSGVEPTWPDDEPGNIGPMAAAMADEIARLRLTDAEREAVRFCVTASLPEVEKLGGVAGELCRIHAATLRGLLERLK